MEFSVIIPVFNHPEYTKLCLDSVAKSSAKIIVIDNGSLGKTRHVLRAYGSRISVIRNETNQGIATALNQGVASSTTDKIVMLHNDCIVLDGFDEVVKECFGHMEGQNTKLATPLTNYADESAFVWSRELQNSFTSNKMSNKSRPTIEEIQNVVQKTYQRYGGVARFAGRTNKFAILAPASEISSFCMLTEKAVFDQVGGFCGRFQLRGYEEKELLCRYNQKGYQSGRAGFFVHHFGNITSDGPGLNFRHLLELNDKIFIDMKNNYEVQNSWTAVVFPDRNPSLMERARANLMDLNWPPEQIIEIPQPGIFPIAKAWDWVVPQIKYNAFGRLDADMLLKRDAVHTMLAPFKDLNVAMTVAHLDDPCIGKVGSLVFWQTFAFKNIDHAHTPAMDYERFYLDEIRRMGLRVEWIDEILADHALVLEPWNIFRAYFRRGLKQRIRGLGSEQAVNEIAGAIKKDNPWGHVALLAFHLGIGVDYNADPHNKAYEDFAGRHYEPVRPFCEAIVAKEAPSYARAEPDMRIRVALISDCLEIGGMEIVIKLLDELIDESKFNLFIYSAVGGALQKELKCKNIRIAHISPRIGNRLRKLTCQRIRGWLVHDQIEVAINMAFRNAADIFHGEKPCRVIERTDGKGFAYIETPGITDLVVYESEYMKSILPEFPCRNHVTITNGRKPFTLDTAARDDVRRTLGMGTDDLLVVNIARLDAIKNQQHLVLMANELLKRGCTKFRLAIMGPDHSGLRAQLEALIAENHLEQIVSIFDETITTEAMLSAADIFVTSSITEGLSGALVEAVVAGLPIVATNVGATRELVSERNGVLVPPNNLVALVAGMERVLLDVDFRSNARAQSLAIAKNYSAMEMTKQFERIISEQADAHRNPTQASPPVASAGGNDKVTIVMPCRDQKIDFLKDAIESVMGQTSPDWNLVVVIDADTPTSIAETVLSYKDERIRLVISDAAPGKAVAGAVNVGIRETKTKFACILLSHDRLHRHAVAVLHKNIKDNPGIDFFHSARAYMSSKGVIQAQEMPAIDNFTSNYFKTVGSPVKHLLCWNVEAGRAVGGMDEELGMVGSDDYDFPWTMFEAGYKFKAIKECLYFYRIHHEFYRGTVNIPIAKHVEILRKMFKKHGVSEGETDGFVRKARAYLIRDKQLDYDKNMNGIIRLSKFNQATEERREEFVSKGHHGRNFFPHRAYCLPKAGPDAVLLFKRTCGISNPSQIREIVLYATGKTLEEFPKELFKDKDLVWHQQHFGKDGQVATANLAIDGDSLYGGVYISDICQRISRRREHKTRIENRFGGWPCMLYNSIMDFAVEAGIRTFYSPTADNVLESCVDKSRTVGREMFDAIYDVRLLECFEAVRNGGFWAIDVLKNINRIVPLRREDEVVEMGKTICVCHDTEGTSSSGTRARPAISTETIRAMLAIEEQVGVKATYNIVGCLLNEVRRPIEDGGHCVAFHSYDHDLRASQLLNCRKVDYRIKGYRPPQSKITQELNSENLCLYNFEWLAAGNGVLMVDIPTIKNGIVNIPILFDDFPLSSGVDYATWEERAVRLAKENYFVAFCLHDCYAQYWLPHYEQFLEKISGLGRFVTMDDVAGEVFLSNAI